MASTRNEAHASPQLLTARYSTGNLAEHPAAKVRTTLGYPRFRLKYNLAANIAELAPTRSMFGMREEQFRGLYTALLEQRGGVEHLRQRFTSIARDAGAEQLVLLCFEDIRKPGLFCHRRVFATWWEQETGEIVSELPEETEMDVVPRPTGVQ